MTKQILIDSSFGLIRTAITQGGKLLDYYEESPDQGRSKGNIYKGQVKKVEGHIQAAFVRYGSGRDGFLPLRDGMVRGESDSDPAHGSGEPVRGAAPADSGDPEHGAASGEGEARGGSQDADGTQDAGGAPENGAEAVREVREVRGGRRSQAQALRGGRGRKGRGNKRAADPGRKTLAPGDFVLVQVVKDEVGGKGAALTTRLSLSGRYLVYMPDKGGEGGISSRIGDEERAALKKAMADLSVPPGASIILRTAALGKPAEELQADLDRLVESHREILETAYYLKEPGLVYREAPPAQRYLREYYTSDVDRVWVNTEELLEECRQFFRLYEPKAVSKVALSRDGALMFQKQGLEAEVEKLSARKVTLPSGANFVIDQTEALVAIDVNSAKSRADGMARGGDEEERGEPRRGRRDLEESVFAINMEAAGEIARQLRLRDLGGIIIVDFIDMEEDGHRRKVEAAMRRALSGDKAKVKAYDITPLGLMQISRQRLRKAGPHFSRAACEACQGRGWHASPSAAASAVLRRLEEKVRGRRSPGAVTVTVPFPVANRLLNEFRPYVLDMEARHGSPIRILADASAAGEPVFSAAPESAPAALPSGKGPRGREHGGERGSERAGGGKRPAPGPAHEPVEAAISIPESGVVMPPDGVPRIRGDVPSPEIGRLEAGVGTGPGYQVETADAAPEAGDIRDSVEAHGVREEDLPAPETIAADAEPEGAEAASREQAGSQGRRGRGRRGGRHRGRKPEKTQAPKPAQPQAAGRAPAPARTPPPQRHGDAQTRGNQALGERPPRGGGQARGAVPSEARKPGEGEGGKRRRSRHRPRKGGGASGGGQPAAN